MHLKKLTLRLHPAAPSARGSCSSCHRQLHLRGDREASEQFLDVHLAKRNEMGWRRRCSEHSHPPRYQEGSQQLSSVRFWMRDAMECCRRCPVHSDLHPAREGAQQLSDGLLETKETCEAFSGISIYVLIVYILRNLRYGFILQQPMQGSLAVLVTSIHICAAIKKHPNKF